MSKQGDAGPKRINRIWFGGVAASMAVVFTQPLDLLKVLQQTQTERSTNMFKLAATVLREDGPTGLHAGLTPAMVRQLCYTTTRFGIYEFLRRRVAGDGGDVTLLDSIACATVGGLAGGFVGAPFDVINVRMQTEKRLPPEKRRGYRNVFHGLLEVWKNEGRKGLFGGGSFASIRCMMLTIGQISSYDTIKQAFLRTGLVGDTTSTHLLTSVLAGMVATILCQPPDMIKTRIMHASPGEYKNAWQVIRSTAAMGPLGFYKGSWPAFIHQGPQTILTFIFMEQMRLNFGILVPPSPTSD